MYMYVYLKRGGGEGVVFISIMVMSDVSEIKGCDGRRSELAV